MRKVVFDIETRNIFEDVGKNDPTLLDISVVALHDSLTDSYSSFVQEEFVRMWPVFESADALIGFNSEHFDIPLLNKYYSGDLTKIKSIDLMAAVKNALGRRLSLGNIAQATLGIKKSADGLQAYNWWKEGKVQEIRDYCVQDVKVTKELYEHILEHRKIKYRDGQNMFELPIDTTGWEDKGDHSMTFSLGF
jgi:DEAD/DEAH box helicase domain-containing protein